MPTCSRANGKIKGKLKAGKLVNRDFSMKIKWDTCKKKKCPDGEEPTAEDCKKYEVTADDAEVEGTFELPLIGEVEFKGTIEGFVELCSYECKKKPD